MALIRTGVGIAAISGKVGGVVFAQTRNGIVARGLGKTTRNTSARALERNTRYAYARFGWGAKTDEERQAWRTAAGQIHFPNRLGLMRNISGYQLFMKLALLSSFPRDFSQLIPPIMTLSEPLENPGLSIEVGGVYEWTYDNVFPDIGPFGYTYAARPFTTAPTTSSRFWTFIKFGQINVLNPQLFATEFNEQMGTPIVGERIGIRFMIRTGTHMPGHLYELWTFAT